MTEATVENCLDLLTQSFGRAEARCFEKMLSSLQLFKGRQLTDEEIGNLCDQFADEICRTVFTRAGK
jgi:hypothetical protein